MHSGQGLHQSSAPDAFFCTHIFASADMTPPPRAPEFGEADLSNCELEKIHVPSSIQPHGAMLVVREYDLVIMQASAGAHEFLELDLPVMGAALAQIGPELSARVGLHLNDPLGEIPAILRCRIGRNRRTFDGVMHRPPSGCLVIELEHAGPEVDLTADLARSVATIAAAPTLRSLCDESARLVKAMTGYDRVMIYRFDEAGHGNVFAEEREPGLEPYLGNYYPASDIPQMARRLYERARVRLLVDVNYTPVPLQPSLSPVTGEPLDMSLCRLRSMSPIHIQYLKNMGVRATLVISVMVSGRLWGLIACHHYAPRRAQFETLAVCEILAETLATRIAALESFNQGQAQLLVRRVEQRMIDAASRQGDWRAGLFDGSD
ncbi:MAG: GAF domain-containing protein, partial [Acetobacteraceae bacterium]|nr:GAF domain-containing protein [Acetobacteraceae bacterium]